MAWEFSDEAKNLMLDALDTAGMHISAHTADPGTTGTAEVTGGAPAYARQVAGYDPAAAGSMALTTTETLDIPTGTTVAFLGIWKHVSSTAQADWMGRVDIGDEVFNSQGTLDVTALTLALDQDPA